MTTLALSDESAENLQCDTKNTKAKKTTTPNPNNNPLRQYESIIKMFVCVRKQLKMNGEKKQRSNKQTATAKRHLNDTFCVVKSTTDAQNGVTHRQKHPSNKRTNLKCAFDIFTCLELPK